jgi:hypothetical protein
MGQNKGSNAPAVFLIRTAPFRALVSKNWFSRFASQRSARTKDVP